MKKNPVMVYILILWTLLLSVGCGNGNEDKKSLKIGVTAYDQYDTFINLMLEDIKSYSEEKARDTGKIFNIEIFNAANSQITQNEQVKSMIANDCDVICVNLVDRTDTSTIIDMAKNADIPVIFFNRELVEEDLERWDKLYYVGAEAFESGRLQGKLTGTYINEHSMCDKNADGVLQYVMLEGEAGHQDAIVRTEYSIKNIEDCGISLEKVGGTIANWNRDQARAKVLSLIEQNINIELIICNNDAMALGAIDAYDLNDIEMEDRPIITGIDGIPEALQDVKEGRMLGTVYNDRIGQAKAIMDLAYELSQRDSAPKLEQLNGRYIRLPYLAITRENIDTFMENKN